MLRKADAGWLSFLAMALVGCTHAPPPGEEIKTSLTPGAWKAEVSENASTGLTWEDLTEPVLADLINEALAHNPDLLSAVEALAASRLALRGAKADRAPNYSVDARAGLSESRNGGMVQNGSLSAAASYEIDLWGRLTGRVNQAELDVAASELSLVTARISLAAETASAYFSLRATDELLGLRRRSLENARRILEFTVARHEAGLTSGLDVDQQYIRVFSLQSGLEDLKAERSRQEQRLAVLIGRPPQSFSISAEPRSTALLRLAPRTPAAVLRARPDIRIVEIRLAQSFIDVDLARKAFLPTVSLNGDSGFASNDLAELFRDSNFSWSGAVGALVTLLDNGARRRAVKGAKIASRQQLLGYRQTILSALAEVEDALIEQERSIRQVQIQQLQLEAQERLTLETEANYRAGRVSAFELVQQQDALLDAQEQIVTSWLDGMTTTVTLLRVLGVEPAGREAAQARPAVAPFKSTDPE